MPKDKRFKARVAVFLILKKGDDILLYLRENTGYGDGKYSLVSGHLDGYETALSAMVREAKEEAGIDIKQKDLNFVCAVHRFEEMEYIDFFFVAEKWDGQIINMESNKCGELKFFPLNELPDNMIPCVREALEKYKAGETYLEFGFA